MFFLSENLKLIRETIRDTSSERLRRFTELSYSWEFGVILEASGGIRMKSVLKAVNF